MLMLSQRHEFTKDLAPNVNFFMNVPVTPEGSSPLQMAYPVQDAM